MTEATCLPASLAKEQVSRQKAKSKPCCSVRQCYVSQQAGPSGMAVDLGLEAAGRVTSSRQFLLPRPLHLLEAFSAMKTEAIPGVFRDGSCSLCVVGGANCVLNLPLQSRQTQTKEPFPSHTHTNHSTEDGLRDPDLHLVRSPSHPATLRTLPPWAGGGSVCKVLAMQA